LYGSDGDTLLGPAVRFDEAERVRKASVEKGYLTPLDGARLISSISATLFGYDEFILREISPETWLASAPMRR
jgi:hypothetical protein